jgi:hypothetical protein
LPFEAIKEKEIIRKRKEKGKKMKSHREKEKKNLED